MTVKSALKLYEDELEYCKCNHDRQVLRGLIRKYKKLSEEGKGNEQIKTFEKQKK